MADRAARTRMARRRRALRLLVEFLGAAARLAIGGALLWAWLFAFLYLGGGYWEW